MGKILVTGGAGFIGSVLVEALVDQGEQVFVFDLSCGNVASVEYLLIDLTDKERVANAIQKIQPEMIYHLAAKVRGSAEELYLANVMATKNILDTFSGRVVFMTTGMVYQGQAVPYKEDMVLHPLDEYGKTKKLCEDFFLQRKKFAIVRASVVYGSGQKSPMFMSSLKEFLEHRDGAFHMTRGEQKRDFIHVADLVRALLLFRVEEFNGIFNIAYGESFMMRDVVTLAKELVGDFPVDMSLAYREKEMWDYAFDISKAREVLHWIPRIGLKDGLRETLSGSL